MTNLWFTEEHTPNVRFSLRMDKIIMTAQSEYQRIDIFDTPEFGRVLALDGCLMVTEKDEFIYHDMIVHVPMAVNPDIKTVLVIGAGDGGTVRELTRYPSIDRIDMVEIDRLVVDACKRYLPQTACRLDDERVNIFYEDGVRYVRQKENEYDLVIVDSTDPFGPGEGLFTREFYGNCYNALKEDGILVNQHESPFYDIYADSVKRARNRINELFPICKLYQAFLPTYPSGHWLFGFASKKFHPTKDLDGERWEKLNIDTKYYNVLLHKGAFALPNYVMELLKNEYF